MIKATIIADSVSEAGDRITTFELEYPRFILAEVNTHRLFSRNSASSRAIPIEKMIEMIENSPAVPSQWGKNQSGMQANSKFEKQSDIMTCEWLWREAAKSAVKSAKELQSKGLHKQIVNRVLEPFQTMKTIVTATEFDNFFWLRCHTDAQPEIHVLADLMYEEYTKNEPQMLKAGEWHLPYVSNVEEVGGLENAKKISASCCAQVSYRKTDDSLEKALKIYDMLVTMTPVHASPFEHIATPIDYEGMGYSPEEGGCWDAEGVTHINKDGNLWSNNLKGWVQYRQLISGNTCWDFKKEN